MSKMDHTVCCALSLPARKAGWAKVVTIEHIQRDEAKMLFKNGSQQAKHPAARSMSSAPSILSDDLTIEGDIVSEGEVHINGVVKGDVTARTLTFGTDGAITGTIEVADAVIGGKLAGRLTATSVVLLSTARVSADITHVSLAIAPEAVFEGFSRRIDTIDAPVKDGAAHPLRLTAPAM
jgi:cytoskeletal protein CcmA (bactofilin family)